MFTGLIQDVGTVDSVELGADGARLQIATSLAGEIEPGDSVAVNGVCLTATSVDGSGFETEAMNQTLAATTLEGLSVGSLANLELAMQASDRFGGHIVQGHVDGVGEIKSIADDGFAKRIRVTLASALMPYMTLKSSVTLDGVSLTIAELGADWVEVSLVPETLKRTTLGEAEPGRKLNVECDVIAKHVERLMAPFAGKERT